LLERDAESKEAKPSLSQGQLLGTGPRVQLEAPSIHPLSRNQLGLSETTAAGIGDGRRTINVQQQGEIIGAVQPAAVNSDQFISGNQSSGACRTVDSDATNHHTTVAVGQGESMVGALKRDRIEAGSDHGEAVVQRQDIRLIEPVVKIGCQRWFQGLQPGRQITPMETAPALAMGLPETTEQIS